MSASAVTGEFAQAVIDRDFGGAYALTTTGLRARIDLETFIRALEAAEADVVPPHRFDLGGNSLTFDQLSETQRRAGTAFPPDIDPAGFQKWVCIQFQPGEDDESGLDACYDFWCMVVNEGGEDRIAYFEIQDPD